MTPQHRCRRRRIESATRTEPPDGVSLVQKTCLVGLFKLRSGTRLENDRPQLLHGGRANAHRPRSAYLCGPMARTVSPRLKLCGVSFLLIDPGRHVGCDLEGPGPRFFAEKQAMDVRHHQPPEQLVGWACRYERWLKMRRPADRAWWRVPPPPAACSIWESGCPCGRSTVPLRGYGSDPASDLLYLGQCPRCEAVLWSLLKALD
jgi:hypothetical protein